MPLQTPPTPFLPSRFTEESLLLTTEPFFGDVDITLEDDDSEWPVAGPSRLDTPNTVGRNKTLDLDAYLPRVEVTDDSEDGNETIRIEAEWIQGRSGIHKRGGSESSTRERESSGTKRARPAPVPVPMVERDDLYSRRLSGSISSRPSSPALPLLMLPSLSRPSLPNPPSLPRLSSSSSSSSRSALSSRSAGSTSVGPEAKTSERFLGREISGDASLDAARRAGTRGMIEEDSASVVTPRPDIPRSSALSRYLAQSAVLHPIPSSTSRSSSSLTSSAGHSPLLIPLSCMSDAALGRIGRVELPVPPLSGTPVISPSLPDLPPPDTIVKTLMPGSLPLAPRADVGATSSPRAPSYTLDQPKRDSPGGASSDESRHSPRSISAHSDETQSTSKESRRTSTSERVLSFFAGFLKGTISTDNEKQVTPKTASQSDKGDEQGSSFGVAEGRKHPQTAGERSGLASDPGPSVPAKSGTTTKPITRPQPNKRAPHFPAPLTKPLTRPVPPPRQPLQPARNQPLAKPAQSATITKMSINTSKPTSASIAKPHIRPTTTSAFASAALARLPPPGKGASSSSKPVMIRPAERALNLPKTRAVFESHPYNPVKRPGIPKTVPLHGRTPGKASRQRVEQREAFDSRVRERMEKEDRERREEERLREEEEEEEYRRRRKQTVIWAKPVPSIYRAG